MAWDDSNECPLCMEPLDVDDISFFPCTCGYQICRFCWHRIRTDENGLCPACRKQYQEGPAEFKPLTEDELHRIKRERKQKDHQRKQKAAESKRHLANLRVVQKNLVFVIGLSQRLADPDILKRHEYFGRFGKIMKVVINQGSSHTGSSSQRSATGAGAAAAAGQSASAYITYFRPEDCLHAIQAVNNKLVDGRTLKASLGTTKYCSHFLKGSHCPKQDCMYLHELGDDAASFTKEEMQANKHHDYEMKLADMYMHNSSSAGGPSSGCSGTSAAIPTPASVTPPPTSNRRVLLSSTPPQQPASLLTANATNNRKKGEPQVLPHPVDLVRGPEVVMPGGDAKPVPIPVAASKLLVDTQSSSSTTRIATGGLTPGGKALPADGNSNTNCGSSPPLVSQSTVVTMTSLPINEASQTSMQRDLDAAGAPGNSSSNRRLHPASDATTSPTSATSTCQSTAQNPVLTEQRQLNVPLLPLAAGVEELPTPCDPRTEGVGSNIAPPRDANAVDWQAAFGFVNDTDLLAGDDDLGFDPWDESSKALADLMAKEQGIGVDGAAHVSSTVNGGYWPAALLPANGLFPPGSRLASLMGTLPPTGQALPTLVTPATASVQSSFSISSGLPLAQTLGNVPHVPSEYVGGASNHRSGMFSLHRHAFSSTNGLVTGHDVTTSADLSSQDWQEGLKALLPNVPIRFGAPLTLPKRPEIVPPGPRHALANHLHKSWNGNDRKVEDWTDPAIIMSSAVPVAADHCPPPHWMKSIQQLADSTSEHSLPLTSGTATKHSSRLPFVHSFPAAGTNGWPPVAVHNPPPGFHHNNANVYRVASAASQAAHIQRQES